jgi:hypothetical protein
MKVLSNIKNSLLSLGTGLAVIMAMSVGLMSCDVATNSNKGSLKVVMFDAPGEYEEVWVHIRRVEVNNVEDEDTGWYVVSEPDERYNLLELVNGANVVLGEAELDEGTYRQIRLILGSDNEIVVNGVARPLTVPSGQQTGIKLNVDAEIVAGFTYTLLLDFDVQRSIVKAGASGMYLLKPVIRAMNQATTGQIAGELDPAVEGAWVRALQDDEVMVSTQTDSTGSFLMVGVLDGFYTVTVDAGEDFEGVEIPGVEVKAGQVTNLGTIELTAVEGDDE